jgi:OmpA-OmpF porin, OOP family
MRDTTIAAVLAVGVLGGGGAAAQPVDPPGEAVEAAREIGPRSRTIDVGGFLGVATFGDDELGNAWAAEQSPGTAVVIGGRGGVTILPDLAPGSPLDPQLGVEAELQVALTATGEDMAAGRRSYFAPVIGWRAHLIARLRTAGTVHPHLVLGGGGESVVSASPFLDDDTDAAFHWGAGVTWRTRPAWIARFDLRHGVIAGRDDDLLDTFTVQVGVERSFDLGRPAPPRPPPPLDTDGDGIVDADDACVTEPEDLDGYRDDDGCPDPDNDGDGILDADDACPLEPEDLDGHDDADGCPDPDNDGDGILDGDDRCPDQAEDLDQFEDDDGCPDPDNDLDGILDAVDACPLEPETYNGFADGDGCPDVLPKVITEFTGAIQGITFEYSRARIQPRSRAVLDRAAQVLHDYPDVRVRIEGHTDPMGIYDKNKSLSLRRAETVKWYLVDLGVAADRLETVGHGPDVPRASNKTAKGRAHNRRIEFHLIVAAPPTGPVAAEPAPLEEPPTEPTPSGP